MNVHAVNCLEIIRVAIQAPPYWVMHGVVAFGFAMFSLLALPRAAAALCAGFWFYLGREVRDWEKLHNYDWHGIDWPGIGAPTFVTLVMIVLYYTVFS